VGEGDDTRTREAVKEGIAWDGMSPEISSPTAPFNGRGEGGADVSADEEVGSNSMSVSFDAVRGRIAANTLHRILTSSPLHLPPDRSACCS